MTSLQNLPNPNQFFIYNGKLCVKFGGEDFINILTVLKNIEPRGKYNPSFKQWEFDISQYEDIKNKLSNYNFSVKQNVFDYFSKLEKENEDILKENENCINFIREWLKTNWKTWGFKPYKHQLDTIKFFINRPTRFKSCLISDDMGLGKTISASLCAESYRQWYSNFTTSDVMKLIVVCPAFLKYNWQKELDFLHICDALIYSYNKVPNQMNENFILIVDECHYTQNPKSERSKKLINLGSSSHCMGVIAISGTPMPNGRPIELYNTLKLVRHNITSNKPYYEKTFCNAHPTAFTNWDTSGVSNLDKFNDIIADINIRRLKSDCLDLPEKKIIELYTDNDEQDLREYATSIELMKNDYLKRVADFEVSDTAQAMVFINYYRQAASLLKAKYAIKLAKNFIENGEPVVVFTEFVNSAEKIAYSLGVTAITGDVNADKRRKIIDDFQLGKTSAFVSTCGASGVGVTLTQSSNLIMVDRCWTPGKNNQVYDRIHRIGQKNSCFIFNLMSGQEICEFMAGINGQKSKVIDKLFKSCRVTTETKKNQSLKQIAQWLMNKK